MARPEKRCPAADDARGAMRCNRILLYRRAASDPGTDRDRRLEGVLRAHRLCRVAYVDAGLEKPRALARLHLRHHGGDRLACPGDRGCRLRRRLFWLSSRLSASEATGPPRMLNPIQLNE